MVCKRIIKKCTATRIPQCKSDYGWSVYDGHGSVVALTDDSGAVRKNYQYDAFGIELGEQDGEDRNPFRYNSEYTDYESGYVYMRARYYSAEIGRFISQDPICDGYNWYGFANNNPIDFIDPTGLFAGSTTEFWQSYSSNQAYEESKKAQADYNTAPQADKTPTKKAQPKKEATKKSSSLNPVKQNTEIIGKDEVFNKYTAKTTVSVLGIKNEFTYEIERGMIHFNYAENNYNYAAIMFNESAKRALAKGMMDVSKELNPDYLKDRTVGGLVTELDMHFAGTVVSLPFKNKVERVNGIYEDAVIADMGSLIVGPPDFNSIENENFALIRSANRLVARPNIRYAWNLARDISDRFREEE